MLLPGVSDDGTIPNKDFVRTCVKRQNRSQECITESQEVLGRYLTCKILEAFFSRLNLMIFNTKSLVWERGFVLLAWLSWQGIS